MNIILKRVITSTIFIGVLIVYSICYAQNSNDQKEYKQMTRQEWLKLPQQEQRVAFRSMSNESQYKFWQDKFKETKQLNWSKEELKHIQKAEDFILQNKSDLFLNEKDRDVALQKLSAFTTQWMEEGEKNFGWTKDLMFHIIADGGIFTNQILKSLRK